MGGITVNPSSWPAGRRGRSVNAKMPSTVTARTGRAAGVRKNARRLVRSSCRMRTCVHMDSRKHPVWKREMKNVFCSSPRVKKLPPQRAGHRIKKRMAKVSRSNRELTGPNTRIKRLSVRPDHSSGRRSCSSSTLSHGRIRQRIS